MTTFGATGSPRRSAAIALLSGLLVAASAPAAVKIDGLSRANERMVRTGIRLDDEGCDAPEWRVRRLFREAEEDVREVLQVRGYYRVQIQRKLEWSEDCWIASFTIDAGEAVRLREVRVTLDGDATGDPVFSGILSGNPLATGQQLDHQAYESYKRRFSDAATQRGYFEAGFAVSRIDVWPADGAADITLDFDSGPRYRFGEVEFEQDVVTERLVRRFVAIEPGTPFEGARIGELYAVLYATGYFDLVDIRTNPRPAPYLDVPFTVILTAAAARDWTIGIGYGTDTGPKLLSSYLNRRRNADGHQLELQGSLSQVISEAGATYRLPLEDPRAEWLSLNAGYKLERPDKIRSELLELGVRAVQRRPRGWLETRFVDFRLEQFEIGQDSGTSRLLTPGLNWVHRTGADLLRPQAAHRVSLQLSGTSEYFGSDTQFLQTEAFGRVIRPLWSGARVLARAEAGFTAKDDFSDLPFSVRYFAGGDFSVRGYDYKTLGPTDASGEVVGGSHKLIASLEVDQLVSARWAVAAFVDSGNAFDDFDRMRLKTGVGAGIRWISPLGPIRLDIAVPLASDARDDWRLHVTLGPDL